MREAGTGPGLDWHFFFFYFIFYFLYLAATVKSSLKEEEYIGSIVYSRSQMIFLLGLI